MTTFATEVLAALRSIEAGISPVELLTGLTADEINDLGGAP